MAKKKKEVQPVEEKYQPMWVEKLEDLKRHIDERGLKLNPMEKVMATELLLNGYYFYVQYKIDLPEGWTITGRKYFIADFLIADDIEGNVFNIVIETDGKVHLTEENQIKDRGKNNALTALGYRVFRFSWDEVMKTDEGYNVIHFIDFLTSEIKADNDLTRYFANENAKSAKDNAGVLA